MADFDRWLRLSAKVSVAIAAVVCWAVAVAGGPAPSNLDQYDGTYRFDDGVCITGGRFDESGKERLLLTDTAGNRRGGLFEAQDDQFLSIIDRSTRLAFAADGAQLSWITPEARRVARRIHAPRRAPVRIQSGGVTLAGSLYLPAASTRQPLPAIVLAHGSGPQNRHGGPWTTFFVDMGFAVLSYDKRGVGESGGDLKAADFRDLAGDLSAAVDWLAAQPQIDPRRVGIHASSQSGWYAPAVAAGNSRVGFLIVRAGPPMPTGPTTLHERLLEWREQGLSEHDTGAAAGFWREVMSAAASGGTREEVQRLLDGAREQPWFASAFGDWREVRSRWWQQEQVNGSYQPVQNLARRRVPTLWFLAERDQNVPYAQSLLALSDARALRPQVSVVSVRDADHGFLVHGADGAIRYTDQYWPLMASWLWDRGLAGAPTPATACGKKSAA